MSKQGFRVADAGGWSLYLEQATGRVADTLQDAAVNAWLEARQATMDQAFSRHGTTPGWEAALANVRTDHAGWHVSGGVVHAGAPGAALTTTDLEAFVPWRKGPFSLGGIALDAEWRSDLKWQRVESAVPDLAGTRVLDVGCGNGYYAWRMLASGAEFVVGLDPGLLAVNQFRLVQRLAGDDRVCVLPLGSEHIDCALGAFDRVFSMGVLYHRREPLQHLAELQRALKPGGRLILETLVIDAEDDRALEPRGRYARMRNVWQIPSVSRVLAWLRAGGYGEICCHDVSITTTQEQRATRWMPFHSLQDFLDQDCPQLTVEGHPAPRRALFSARWAGA